MSGADLAGRLASVRAAIDEATRAANRDPAGVRLVAVSKLHPAEAIGSAFAAGQRLFGENYAQELRDKSRLVPSLLSGSGSTPVAPEAVAAFRAGARPAWHFIGPLQRNKVKYVVGVADLIHTVDSRSLLEEIARRADSAGLVQPCLIEVDVADEPQKAGVHPDELPAIVDAFVESSALRLDGLMCIPPVAPEGSNERAAAEWSRPFFERLRLLQGAERARTGLALPELSMGMSSDFAVAIQEGATIVRVGTAIFGERPARAQPKAD